MTDRNSCRVIKTMDYVRLYIDNLNEGNKTIFRRLEKLNYKSIEATNSIRFNPANHNWGKIFQRVESEIINDVKLV